jgi:hypothetical protein
MPVEDASYIGREFDRLKKAGDIPKEIKTMVNKYPKLVKFCVYNELGYPRETNDDIIISGKVVLSDGEFKQMFYAARIMADIINANYEARE